eukprot:43425-Pelagomonas_calceolata.AAC.3
MDRCLHHHPDGSLASWMQYSTRTLFDHDQGNVPASSSSRGEPGWLDNDQQQSTTVEMNEDSEILRQKELMQPGLAPGRRGGAVRARGRQRGTPEVDNSPPETGVLRMLIAQGAPNLRHSSLDAKCLFKEVEVHCPRGTLPNQPQHKPCFLTTKSPLRSPTAPG